MKHNGNSPRCTAPACAADLEPIPLEAGNHIVGCTECARSYLVRRGHEGLKVLEVLEPGSTAGPERGRL